jgi:arylsulfatase A-like enzyme/acetyl esterase/lipase
MHRTFYLGLLKQGLLTVMLVLFIQSALAQVESADRYDIYKQTPQRDLGVSMYFPSNWEEKQDWPMIIFFHGGGWKGGNPVQFLPLARYFKARGMVCALVEYRIKNQDGTDPFVVLQDAKSAVRFLKKNAAKYGIDTDKIVLSGGSAGGHLAAACQWVSEFDDAQDDLSINTKGGALVLFNPVIDNGPNGYGYDRVGEQYKAFSPYHQPKDETDVLVMSGTKDKLLPVATIKAFKKEIDESGGRCTAVLYEDATHAFFNKGRHGEEFYQKTKAQMDDFLVELGLLPKKERPNILWITIEDTSPQFIGCYGNAIATPNIDKLASEGVKFNNAFSTGTVCSPSRTAIITGVKTYETGTGHHRSKYKIPSEIKGFPYYLKQQGYFTSNNYKTDYNVNNEAGFIEEAWHESSDTSGWWNGPANKPFFSIVNFHESHQSRTMTNTYDWYLENVLYQLPENERIAEDAFDLPPYYHDSPEMRKQFARVYNSIRLTDIRVGKLLERLEEDGLKDNTVIFFYADHGEGIPRGKTNGIGLGYRVPFIVSAPENFQYLLSDVKSDELLDFTDLAATMMSLTGAEKPEYLNGRAFLGDQRRAGPDLLYLSSDRADNGADMVRSVTDGRYIYSRNFMSYIPELRYIRYMEIAKMKQIMRQDLGAGLLDDFQESLFEPRAIESLYDLEADPWEENNLVGKTDYDSLVTVFRNAMIKELTRVSDILFLPEYEIGELQNSTTAYEFRLSEEYNISAILGVAMLSGRIGEEVAQKQIELLRHENKFIRYWAATGLKSQPKGILANYKKQILRASADPYPPVAILGAMIAFDHFENKKAQSAIAHFCTSDNEHIALATLNHLLYIDSPEPYIDAVRSVLEMDRSVPVRSACYDFLGALGLVPDDMAHLD